MEQSLQEREIAYQQRQRDLEEMQAGMAASGQKALEELRKRMQSQTNHSNQGNSNV